jgi:type IV secretion system protein VirD4
MQERLYGWSAPSALGMRRALSILILFPLVSLQVTLAIMTLIWGPPTPVPLLPYEASRLMLLSVAGLAIPWLLRPTMRPVLVPLVVVSCTVGAAPIHSPHHAVRALANALSTPDLMGAALFAFFAGSLAGMLLARGIIMRATAQLSLAKGSTKWGNAHALKKPTEGFLLGKIDNEYLRYDGDGHLITIAATRSGKGVGAVMPNLLNYTGSMLITDPKGENYAVTAAWRRDHLRQKIVALDPFDLTKGGDSQTAALNPMDFIDIKGKDYVETAMMLADMIIGRGHRAEDSHWKLEAKGLLYSFILYVASDESLASDRHLIKVRQLLTQGSDGMEKTLCAMKESKLLQVREGAHRIEQKSDRERSGVFSTAQSHTHFLSSPRMQHVLTSTNCDLEDLRNGKMTVYVVLPREYLSTFAPWLRLIISSCYYSCTHDAAKKPSVNQRVVFLLDEFANLGYMQNIKEAVSLGGGYGLTMWLILQDLAQLKREYHSEWESFLANCGVIQAFAIQDPFTSQKIAQILGEMSIWQRRLNKDDGRKLGRMRAGYEESSRPLLKPDELRRLHPARQLLLVRPYQPVVADKLVYYKDPLTASRAQSNPFAS